MKPFAAIDLTNDKKNETVNGTEFLTKKPSAGLQQALESASAREEELQKRAQLPLVFRILQFFSHLIWIGCFIGLLKGLANVGSIQTIYQNAAWIIWLTVGCFALWVVLVLISYLRKKSVLGAEENQYDISREESIAKAIYAELGVPESARKADTFFFYYKIKNGKLKSIIKSTSVSIYATLSYQIYADEENLHLSSLDGEYTFPKASLKAIRTVKKHITFIGWNKDTPYNEGFYKQFKLRADQYGRIHANTYHILELEKDGEFWGIYFPCYELKTFEVLTGLKAE